MAVIVHQSIYFVSSWRKSAIDRSQTSKFATYPQECDQIVPILALLQSTKGHFRAWDVLLGVLEVFKLSLISLPS